MRDKRKLRLALLGSATVISLVVVAVSIDWKQRDFVSRCENNGKETQKCQCTFAAIPELPDDYQKAAVAWAHGKPREHWLANTKSIALDISHAARNQIVSLAASDGVVRLLANASKRAVSPSTKREFLSDAAGRQMQVRGVYARYCGGLPDQMIVAVHGAISIGKDAARTIGSDAAEATKSVAKKAGGWAWEKATEWWR